MAELTEEMSREEMAHTIKHLTEQLLYYRAAYSWGMYLMQRGNFFATISSDKVQAFRDDFDRIHPEYGDALGHLVK